MNIICELLSLRLLGSGVVLFMTKVPHSRARSWRWCNSLVVEHVLFVWYFLTLESPGADNLHDPCQIENFMSLTLPCGLKGALVGSDGAIKLKDKKAVWTLILVLDSISYIYVYIYSITILPFYVYERTGHIKWQLILKKRLLLCDAVCVLAPALQCEA